MSLGNIEYEEVEAMNTESSLKHFTVKGAYAYIEMITGKSYVVFLKDGY